MNKEIGQDRSGRTRQPRCTLYCRSSVRCPVRAFSWRPCRHWVMLIGIIGILWSGAYQEVTSQVVRGVLLDSVTESPIPGGLVALLDGGMGRVRVGLSDATGRFSLTAPSGGEFSLYGEGLGYYSTVDGPFLLGDSSELAVTFHLQRNPVVIDSLAVSVERSSGWLEGTGFLQRREDYRESFFLNRAEIETRSARRTTDLFRAFGGFRVVPAQGTLGEYSLVSRRFISLQTGPGGCAPIVFLDGVRVGRADDYHSGAGLDRLIDPQAIEAIEAYSGITRVPEQWRGSDAGCGVIVIWSRRE